MKIALSSPQLSPSHDRVVHLKKRGDADQGEVTSRALFSPENDAFSRERQEREGRKDNDGDPTTERESGRDRRPPADAQEPVETHEGGSAGTGGRLGHIAAAGRPERNDANTQIARDLFKMKRKCFTKYRNGMKNINPEFARKTIPSPSTLKTKKKLVRWVSKHIGAIQWDEFQSEDVRDIALVSVAITKYGEENLDKIFCAQNMNVMKNIPLFPSDLRSVNKQTECRDRYKGIDKDDMQASHFIGLYVAVKLNFRLPAEHRLGKMDLKLILNQPINMKMEKKETNLSFHKNVDAILVDPPGRHPTPDESERLKDIVKCAQSTEFQRDMVLVMGYHFYSGLRDMFNALDSGLWDENKDRSELQQHTSENGDFQACQDKRGDDDFSINIDENTQSAWCLFKRSNAEFMKYRNYMKNMNPRRACHILSQFKKTQNARISGMSANIDAIAKKYKLTINDMIDIMLVSAAIAIYGKEHLHKLYEGRKMEEMENIPLDSDDLCCTTNNLKTSYLIGLDVAIELNVRLPVGQRLGIKTLMLILSHPRNLNMKEKESNQYFYKRVDAMLVYSTERRLTTKECIQLRNIVECALSDGFQHEITLVKGFQFYLSLRYAFEALKGKFWDGRKGMSQLKGPTKKAKARKPKSDSTDTERNQKSDQSN